jgi:glyoxylase-like metal-dependent hydrolase (beta-lactamase superfamily II)
MIKTPEKQIPGLYHRRVGDIVVTVVSDGFLDGTLDVLRNITPEEAREILTASFRPARRTAVNTFLIYSAGRLALVDTGSGNYMLPTAGKVLANLAAAGVDPAAIDTVLLTHMHPDHSAGLSDPATGRRYFPNAELVVHENEPRHWFDDAKMAGAAERARKLYFQCAREQTTPYKERTRTFRKDEVFPGVTAIPCPGHTPGHTSFMISSGKEQLLIWGDTVHVPEVRHVRRCAWSSIRTPMPRPPRAGASSTWSQPTGCWSPACTCTFRVSPTWCGAAPATSSSPRPGSRSCLDVWQRARGCHSLTQKQQPGGRP